MPCGVSGGGADAAGGIVADNDGGLRDESAFGVRDCAFESSASRLRAALVFGVGGDGLEAAALDTGLSDREYRGRQIQADNRGETDAAEKCPAGDLCFRKVHL